MNESDYRAFTDFSDHIRAMYAKNSPGFGGITPSQAGYLHFILEHDGCSQQELANLLTSSKGSISEMLSQLESGGFIVRERSREDRRRFCLHLTDRGKKSALEIQAFYRSTCDAGMSSFSDEEKKELVDLLRRFVQNQSSLSDS